MYNVSYFKGKSGPGTKSKNPRTTQDGSSAEPPLKTPRSTSTSPTASGSRSSSSESAFKIPKVAHNPFMTQEPSTKKGKN